MYYYFGIAQQWLLVNGVKKKENDHDTKKETIKIKYFDDLPKDVW